MVQVGSGERQMLRGLSFGLLIDEKLQLRYGAFVPFGRKDTTKEIEV